MCCSWMLYQSIREHIYQKQLAEKHAQELNFVAQREIAVLRRLFCRARLAAIKLFCMIHPVQFALEYLPAVCALHRYHRRHTIHSSFFTRARPLQLPRPEP